MNEINSESLIDEIAKYVHDLALREFNNIDKSIINLNDVYIFVDKTIENLKRTGWYFIKEKSDKITLSIDIPGIMSREDSHKVIELVDKLDSYQKRQEYLTQNKEFTLKELYNMLEQYQTFVCNGVEITSPIHANGPDMCRQLIRLLREKTA